VKFLSSRIRFAILSGESPVLSQDSGSVPKNVVRVAAGRMSVTLKWRCRYGGGAEMRPQA